MARFVTRAELSRMAKVSDTAISKACKTTLAPACEGLRVDVDHPAVLAYLKGKGQKPPRLRPSSAEPPPSAPADRPRSAVRASAATLAGSDEDIEELAELIRPLLERFGTSLRFKDFLASLKTIEDIRGKRIENEKDEGRLIERELVRVHVFGAIERANRQLLTDLPKTITRTLYAAAKSGVPVEDSERTVRAQISDQLKPMKLTAAKTLRHA